jgi:hypothetical protein
LITCQAGFPKTTFVFVAAQTSVTDHNTAHSLTPHLLHLLTPLLLLSLTPQILSTNLFSWLVRNQPTPFFLIPILLTLFSSASFLHLVTLFPSGPASSIHQPSHDSTLVISSSSFSLFLLNSLLMFSSQCVRPCLRNSIIRF